MDEEPLDDGATHLTSLELIAAADGDVDEAALHHLRQCPRCLQRVAALRSLQQALRHRLYRALCPSTDQLVDYCQGLLSPAQQVLIARHIAACPHCSAEIDLLMQRDPLIDRLLLSDLLNVRLSRYAR
ncbi:zf-HC2 domain-containing protein [Chloroflexus sp.]|uniref:zf-HC2 domain-containing protein n=1 Tax=Chloroflexus sp. TaxID=1904827 RepID=UPI00262A1989|nr:zf-HC2 domain-containing protein [uncultured Chloroflexus sp.]